MYTANIFKELTQLKGKFPKGTFNLKNFYNSKQSRIRKQITFTCSQNPHRLFAMFVSNCSLSILYGFILTLCINSYKASFLPSLQVCLALSYTQN